MTKGCCASKNISATPFLLSPRAHGLAGFICLRSLAFRAQPSVDETRQIRSSFGETFLEARKASRQILHHSQGKCDLQGRRTQAQDSQGLQQYVKDWDRETCQNPLSPRTQVHSGKEYSHKSIQICLSPLVRMTIKENW